MIVKAFTFLILVSYAIGELCVHYDFEQSFYELFSDNGVCSGFPVWFIGQYKDLNMIGDKDTTFITPSSQWSASCASSFVFSMKSGGTIEVDIYMERSDVSDQIQVFVSQMLPGGGSFVRAKSETGVSGYSPNGKQTLKIILNGTDTDSYDGFISIVGKAAAESVVLVDAFRYTPPNVDDTFCQDPKNVINPSSNANINPISSRRTTRTTRRTTRRTTTTKRTTVTIKTTTNNETTTYNSTTPNYNVTSPIYSTTLPTVTGRPPVIVTDRPTSSANNLAPIMTVLLSLTVLYALYQLPS